MQIVIHLDPIRLFRWHLELAQALQHAGHEVRVNYLSNSEPLPLAVSALLDIDAARLRTGEVRFSDRIKVSDFVAIPKWNGKHEPELAIDLTAGVADRIARTLRPTYDGIARDDALYAGLIAGRAPEIAMSDTLTAWPWPLGRPALERPKSLAASLDHATSRLVDGALRVVRDIHAGSEPAKGEPHRSAFVHKGGLATTAVRSAFRHVTAKLTETADRARGRERRWHVAWRPIDESRLPLSSDLDLAQFQILPDDRQRYYADPIAIAREGRIHVFVEELPSATNVGVISHFALDDAYRPSTPQSVLDTGSHLSYPMLFQHRGELWMCPESSAAGGLDLFRCHRFPDRWRHETRILDGRFHDATLFRHGDLFWIAAATEAFQSSSWDGLSLYYAISPFGPWRPHTRNPVVVDCRFARPAGPIIEADGQLLRPAQDCSEGYGFAMALRRITTLTPDTFCEETIGPVRFSDRRVKGPHTLSRAGGLEFVDIFCRDEDLRSGNG